MSLHLVITVVLAGIAIALWCRCLLLKRECDYIERHYDRKSNDARSHERNSEWWQGRYERLQENYVKLKSDIRKLLKDECE